MKIKKLMLLALSACAVVAFAAPAAASAVELTQGEESLPTGTQVKATSHNLVTTSPLLGNLECTTVVLHGEVTVNGPEVVQIVETEEATTEGCNHEITIAQGGEILINGGGTGTTVGSLFQVEGICNFSGNVPFTYVEGGSEITVPGEEPQFSGNCGPGTMTGSFTLETVGGEPITIS